MRTLYRSKPAEHDEDYSEALLAFDCAVYEMLNCGSTPDNVRQVLEEVLSRASGVEDYDA